MSDMDLKANKLGFNELDLGFKSLGCAVFGFSTESAIPPVFLPKRNPVANR